MYIKITKLMRERRELIKKFSGRDRKHIDRRINMARIFFPSTRVERKNVNPFFNVRFIGPNAPLCIIVTVISAVTSLTRRIPVVLPRNRFLFQFVLRSTNAVLRTASVLIIITAVIFQNYRHNARVGV